MDQKTTYPIGALSPTLLTSVPCSTPRWGVRFHGTAGKQTHPFAMAIPYPNFGGDCIHTVAGEDLLPRRSWANR